ncbi:fizzy-related protein homolog [Monodelphis domestica]|uniref:CDC20/Fizzy WD40 domain-containing protein n=1 Tax=Monodelphis domestica TaxID=13616 RepID=K7E4E3_MONDO|nr:fizzy-related protein homolog [Monodelphis domestica]XP_056664699.1 fizzy-related protein homolog [Monodelphis domestica]
MSLRRTLSSSQMSSSNKYGDRFIPFRTEAKWNLTFHRSNNPEKSFTAEDTGASGQSGLVYSALLENELLGGGIRRLQNQTSSPQEENLFTYTPSAKRWRPDDSHKVSPYSLSSISNQSQVLLSSPAKSHRKISNFPFKILEAPNLRDDFNLNLLDWSSLDVITVGLGTSVYLWGARPGQITRLCDLSLEEDIVTSVSCSERGKLVGVGTQKGFVQIWDIMVGKKLLTMGGHRDRVGALAWNADQISSGSRDTRILQRDIRASPQQSQRSLLGHIQEVCGLKWSINHQLLASGGNDKKLLIWNHSSEKPLQQYTNHKTTVKAITWSPHQHGLLALNGGKSSHGIQFWDTLTGHRLKYIDTGSHVCNLAWSKNDNELVSTHGYKENEIILWKYPSLTQIAKLTGHSRRVLHLAMSPDGESIITGAGDRTLRFWNVFPKTHSANECASVLNLFTSIR